MDSPNFFNSTEEDFPPLPDPPQAPPKAASPPPGPQVEGVVGLNEAEQSVPVPPVTLLPEVHPGPPPISATKGAAAAPADDSAAAPTDGPETIIGRINDLVARDDPLSATHLISTSPELIPWLQQRCPAVMLRVISFAGEYAALKRPGDRFDYKATEPTARRHAQLQAAAAQAGCEAIIGALLLIGQYIADTSAQATMTARRRPSTYSDAWTHTALGHAMQSPVVATTGRSPDPTTTTEPATTTHQLPPHLQPPPEHDQECAPPPAPTHSEADEERKLGIAAVQLAAAVEAAHRKIAARRLLRSTDAVTGGKLRAYLANLFRDDPGATRRLLRYLIQQSVPTGAANVGRATAMALIKQLLHQLAAERGRTVTKVVVKGVSAIVAVFNDRLRAHVTELLVDGYIADCIEGHRKTLTTHAARATLALRGGGAAAPRLADGAGDGTTKTGDPLRTGDHADLQAAVNAIAASATEVTDLASVVTAALEAATPGGTSLFTADGFPATFGGNTRSVVQLDELARSFEAKDPDLDPRLHDLAGLAAAAPAAVPLTPIVRRVVNVVRGAIGLRAQGDFVRAATLQLVHHLLPTLVAALLDATEGDTVVITATTLAEAGLATAAVGFPSARALANLATVPQRVAIEALYSLVVAKAHKTQTTDRADRRKRKAQVQAAALAKRRDAADQVPLPGPAPQPTPRPPKPSYLTLDLPGLHRLAAAGVSKIANIEAAARCAVDPAKAAALVAQRDRIAEQLDLVRCRIRSLDPAAYLAQATSAL